MRDPSSHRAAVRRQRARARKVLAIAGLLLEHAAGTQYGLAAEQSHPRPPAHLPTLVGGEARNAEMLRALDRPLGRRVPDGDVGVGADAVDALPWIEPEDPRRVLGEHTGEPGDGEPALHDALAVHERLERGRAERNGLASAVD